MPTLRTLSRALAVAALPALAACDGDGGTGGDRLSLAEVAGTYQICALRFQPTQAALPAADVLAAVVNLSPPAGRPLPSLNVWSDARVFDLAYTRKANNALQTARGSVELRSASVVAELGTQGAGAAVAQELLLPSAWELRFLPDPNRLAAGAETGPYEVPRADYARAAGITEDGLQPRISGTMTATLSTAGCP